MLKYSCFLFSQLGESGEIKAIGEVNLLFVFLRDACIWSQQSWKMDTNPSCLLEVTIKFPEVFFPPKGKWEAKFYNHG